MKKDIENRADIDVLMTAFYSRVLRDDLIGFIFTDVAKLDLEHHLPIIGDFWETLLFQKGDYSRLGRNPLQVHGDLNLMTPLLPEYFERWLEIFDLTVEEMFRGARSDYVKMRAAAIAGNMIRYVHQNPAPLVSSREIAPAIR